MAKIPDKTEIDFETGKCVETKVNKAAYIAERMKAVQNPYTGNKRKLVVDIFDFLDRHGVKGNTFCDLFAGSATVAMAAKYLGYNVIANDLMLFPYHNIEAFITHDVELSEDLLSFFVENEPDEKDMVRVVRDHYAHRFTEQEALHLDRYRTNIGLHDSINGYQYYDKSMALVQICHYVMENCFLGGRLNNGQVLADIYHRLNHDRNKGSTMNFYQVPRYKFKLAHHDKQYYGFNQDAVDLLKRKDLPNIDICYIDPPYGGQQSDYAKMYAFFEDFCRGYVSEKIEGSEKFVSTKTYYDYFAELLEVASKIPVLVFSYNDSSWGDISKIIKSIERFGRKVSVEKVDYNYNYRNQERSATEYLILAEHN